MTSRRLGAHLVLLVTAGIFGVFFLWPLAESLRGAFVDHQGHLTLAYVRAVFENPVYVLGFRNSLLVALGSTVLAALVGVPLALIFTRYEFRSRRPRARVDSARANQGALGDLGGPRALQRVRRQQA